MTTDNMIGTAHGVNLLLDMAYDSGYQAAMQSQAARIEELETICAEAYQVVGHFSDMLPDAKLLDNLSQQKLVHKDVLPFTPVQSPEVQKLVELVQVYKAGLEWSLRQSMLTASMYGYTQLAMTPVDGIALKIDEATEALQPFTQKKEG